MCELKNNEGSAVLEMCIVMPIIFIIIANIIFLYIQSINEGIMFGDGYYGIYSYDEVNKQYSEFNARLNEDFIGDYYAEGVIKNDGKDVVVSIVNKENIRKDYETEYDRCTSRLRRWQLYGDVFCE